MANGETIWAYEDDKKPIMDYGTKYHIGVGIVNDKLTYGEWYDYHIIYASLFEQMDLLFQRAE